MLVYQPVGGKLRLVAAEYFVPLSPEVKERLVAYMAEVASGLKRVEQRQAAELYARGLIEAGRANR